MGNWQLEVVRMALYMAFPVALFHYFNQPANYEAWIVQKRQEIYPKANPAEEEKVRRVIRSIREQREREMYEQMENNSEKTEQQ